uniref:Tubulin-specific chaperone A n=1 Tax=Hyaloperonospora arabidopsidis (strain Emoy2) TaxID=559515 RepID=M4BVI7_HYAAE
MSERQFKIKVGTLRRVKKDLEYYFKERTAQQAKIDKMRADDKDEYDIRKQLEVLVETETMLPDCQSRLQEAVTDVSNFIEAHRDEVELLDAFKEAQELLAAIPILQ